MFKLIQQNTLFYLNLALVLYFKTARYSYSEFAFYYTILLSSLASLSSLLLLLFLLSLLLIMCSIMYDCRKINFHIIQVTLFTSTYQLF